MFYVKVATRGTATAKKGSPRQALDYITDGHDTRRDPGYSDGELAYIARMGEEWKTARLVELEQRLAAVDQRVANLADGVARAGFSAALASRLQAEEAAAVQLRAYVEEQRRQHRPKVLPHPKVIEGVLGDLSKLLESDPERSRAVLKRFMPPVVLAPDGDGWSSQAGSTWRPPSTKVVRNKSRRDRD
ncbi:MAG TPA: hypothetical protein VGP64_01805 [Polyangia bacterium]